MLLATSSLATLTVPKGGVTVDVDLTFLWPIGLLIVLTRLQALLFDPMLKLFEERERRIEGAKLRARERWTKRRPRRSREYETEMNKARSAGQRRARPQRAEGFKTEAEIVVKCATHAAKVTDGRKGLQEEGGAGPRGAEGRGACARRAMASRVLGREVQG